LAGRLSQANVHFWGRLSSCAGTEVGVTRTVLATIGQLAVVSGNGFKPFVPDVLPLVIEAIQDAASPDKRIVAVTALGKVRVLWCAACCLPLAWCSLSQALVKSTPPEVNGHRLQKRFWRRKTAGKHCGGLLLKEVCQGDPLEAWTCVGSMSTAGAQCCVLTVRPTLWRVAQAADCALLQQ